MTKMNLNFTHITDDYLIYNQSNLWNRTTCNSILFLQQFDSYYSIVHPYLACLICLFGILTNLLNVIILTQKTMRNPTNIILIGIAITDTLTMIAYVLEIIYLHFLTSPQPHLYPHSKIAIIFLLIYHSISIGTHTISTCLLIQLSVFRCCIIYAAIFRTKSYDKFNETKQIKFDSMKLRKCLDLLTTKTNKILSSLSCTPSSSSSILFGEMNNRTQRKFVIISYVISITIGILISLPTSIIYKCDLINTHANETKFNYVNQTKQINFYWFQLRQNTQLIEDAHFLFYGCFVKILASILIGLFTTMILCALKTTHQKYNKLRQLASKKIQPKINKLSISDTIYKPTSSNNNTNMNNDCFNEENDENLIKSSKFYLTSEQSPSTAQYTTQLLNCAQCQNISSNRKTKVHWEDIITSSYTKTKYINNTTTTINNNNNKINEETTIESKLQQRTRDSQRVTIMLIIVVTSFVITEAPQGVFNTLVAIKGECFLETIYLPLGDLLDILVLLNSSINFILYCTMSQLFRRNFNLLIRKICFNVIRTNVNKTKSKIYNNSGNAITL